jgi:hypothetical protein
MGEWTKVVTQPLGLAGFALFLIFGLVARVKRNDERRWISFVSIVMAVVALVGGLGLAYSHNTKSPASVIQITNGTGVNINGASGGTINIDQSTGKSVVNQHSAAPDAAHPEAQKSSHKKGSPQKDPITEDQ